MSKKKATQEVMDAETVDQALANNGGPEVAGDLVEFATKYKLSEDQIKKLESMEPEARASHIAIIEQASVDASKFNFVDMEEDEQSTMTVFTVGDLVPGQVLAGRLMGTRHIFSKKLKENWKEFVQPDGQVLYYNAIYQFSSLDGKTEWGIFKSPSLNILEKMTTLASKSGKKNPAIQLTYVGKIEGRDVLEKEHGIKLTKGTSAHVFNVRHEPNTEILKYEVRGTVNSLNSPLPMTSNAGGTVDKTQASANNYRRLQAINMGAGAALLDSSIQ